MDIYMDILLRLCTICLFLKMLLTYNKLFKTIPKGESKQWALRVGLKHHLVIVFTNVDGDNGTWHIGVVKISK